MKTKIYLKTPITYYGGKQKMLPEILPEIPEHTLYCEPFAGGAAVFFAKEPAKTNVINDLNAELINFYKVLKHKSKELLKYVDDTLHSRELHKHAWYIYNHPYHFDDVRRACCKFQTIDFKRTYKDA